MDMKKITLAFLLVISYTIVAAQPKPVFKNAVAYNDYIINLQMGIMNSITAFTATFDSTSKPYTESKRMALVVNCKNSIAKLKLMPAYKTNTGFRNAAIELFAFYQLTAETNYKKMTDILFKAKITDADRGIMDALIKAVSEKESVLDKAFLGEQKKFANENNIRLNTTTEAEAEEQ
jgi:hypothetical protein